MKEVKAVLGTLAVVAFALSLPAGCKLSTAPDTKTEVYTVNFDVDGEVYESQQVKDGDTAKKPEKDPSKPGSTFTGWYDGGREFDFSRPVKSNLTLYADWEAVPEGLHIVTFDPNGGSFSGKQQVQVEDGDTVEKPEDPVKPGSTFEDWYTDNGTFKNRYIFNTPVTEDINLYASWQAVPEGVHVVTFDPDGGSFSGKQQVQVKDGDTVEKPEDPVKEGSTFEGWYTDNGGLFDFSTAITGNMTLYARWKTVTYTVFFDVNGGTGPWVPYQTVEAGGSITLPDGSDIEKYGYVFAGWNTQADGGGINYGPSTEYTPDGDITLYATWIVAGDFFTVTYDLNGGTGDTPHEQVVKAGESVYIPGDYGITAPEGYRFNGWNTKADGTGNDHTAGEYWPTASIKLYAKWGPAFYTVTYDLNGGTGDTPPPQTVKAGEIVRIADISSDTSKPGFLFDGWNTQADGKGDNYGAFGWFIPTSDTTLYVKWNASYTVTYDINGGTGYIPPAQTVEIGGSVQIAVTGTDAITKPGFLFDGWNTRADGTGTNYYEYETYTPTASITLYAKWLGVYTVTYDLNGGDGNTPRSQTVEVGESVQLPSNYFGDFTKPGFLFGGWNTRADGTGTNYDEYETYTPTADITMYAKWNAVYTVTYDINGGTGYIPSPETVEPGQSIRLSGVYTNTTKPGHVFGGWNTGADGTGTNYDANTEYTPTASITLYAKWNVWTPLETVQINGGTFTMGDEGSTYSNEKPAHQVTVNAFKMGMYEVTQEQFLAVTGKNPSYFTDSPAAGEQQGKRSVEMVTWLDAVNFCNALSEIEGLTKVYYVYGGTVTMDRSADGYRLPTEAEWEYACRAGTDTQYSFGDNEIVIDDYAWTYGNSDNKTHEVGLKNPNPWGLYDMHGNVLEWCWDWYNENYYQSSPGTDPEGPASGDYHVERGGSWNGDCRCAQRHRTTWDSNYNIGFRIVCK